MMVGTVVGQRCVVHRTWVISYAVRAGPQFESEISNYRAYAATAVEMAAPLDLLAVNLMGVSRRAELNVAGKSLPESSGP